MGLGSGIGDGRASLHGLFAEVEASDRGGEDAASGEGFGVEAAIAAAGFGGQGGVHLRGGA